ncbi:MMPL family transporter [Sulfidibacter corallicola]|uniref:MMPL family transporter n=1 Tax=Sulfidibacter corallicola TaxID=2818388 RepID=A0A8A4TQ01_SULCO|nr:MMPL family transporter [Sulfidibacter corallicola]QTD51162.1 MMPL family transporter [Sulfidibacter corallicola]
MTTSKSRMYDASILARPYTVLATVVLVALFFGLFTPRFQLEASSDSLILDDDADLRYYQTIRKQFGEDSFLIITYKPEGDLFSDEVLGRLRAMVTDLKGLEPVDEVQSILDVPLLLSPKLSIAALIQGLPVLEDARVDRDLAKIELTESPFYEKQLISTDGTTTALQVTLKPDAHFETLNLRRNDLRARKFEGTLSETERRELAQVDHSYRKASIRQTERQEATVDQVRGILDRYRGDAEIHLGGVPMIVADMIDFVRRDIAVFGIGVFLFLVLSLSVIFRRPRFVVVPLIACAGTVLIMIGFLGFVDWRATVISSNFTSLLLIITMSMAIHVAVRYHELREAEPDLDQSQLVARTAAGVGLPCFYCALTTMVGFGSLVVSGIKPVIDFGLMMAVGIMVAYLMVFAVFPPILKLLSRGTIRPFGAERGSLTGFLADVTERRGNALLIVAAVLLVVSVLGLNRLSVDNRFIDYFKESTEIHRGMRIIDQQLGGTVPLEIIVEGEGANYWASPQNLAKLRRIHQFLDDLPETGKVLSLDSAIRVAEEVHGAPMNRIIFAMVRRLLPERFKAAVMDPFVSDDFSRLRLVARIVESDPNLERQALVDKIHHFMREEAGLGPDQYRLTGMYVLYNNMLQSLFRSQITTIGSVFFAILIMFTILFRSLKLALIGIVPNLFPVLLVLGTMGWLDIPLDLMTITIAAITIGIAVDHTIHYIHRFKREFEKNRNYIATMRTCHAGVGRAMYFTSLTIIAGFSILCLSQFIPTIYFGLFTSFAMLVALLASMTLLPKLLLLLQPLGPERAAEPSEEAAITATPPASL